MTAAGFRKLLSRISQLCSWSFSVHPHMLRHACGYKLVNDGHDTRAIQHYLGHRNIQNTVRYTQLSATVLPSSGKTSFSGAADRAAANSTARFIAQQDF